MQKGFTLIEVLIATAILSVVILGVMRVNDNLISVEQGFIQSQDAAEILTNAKLFMGHQNSCMSVFNQALVETPGDEPYTPIEGEFEAIKNFEGNDFLAVGDRYGKIELTSLWFVPREGYFEESEFENERGIIDVFIQVKGIGKVSMKRVKKLPVWVYASKSKYKDARIEYCDSSRTDMVNYITESVMARVCKSFNGILNPKTKLCIFGSEQEKQDALEMAIKSQNDILPTRRLSGKTETPEQVQNPQQLDEAAVVNLLMRAMMMEQEAMKKEKGGQ